VSRFTVTWRLSLCDNPWCTIPQLGAAVFSASAVSHVSAMSHLSRTTVFLVSGTFLLDGISDFTAEKPQGVFIAFRRSDSTDLDNACAVTPSTLKVVFIVGCRP
jgi:hypothetical protein